jgi:hypothetical protein
VVGLPAAALLDGRDAVVVVAIGRARLSGESGESG